MPQKCWTMRRFAVISLLFAPGWAAPVVAQEQFRAAWADVFSPGYRNASEVNAMIASLVQGRYNAVIVQVMAYMDNGSGSSHGAYWKSNILPWCGFTTASFDPLAYLCQRAHENGIEVHAWLGGSGGGPYRVSLVWPPPGNPVLAAHPEWLMIPYPGGIGSPVPINGRYLLDFGSPDVQEYIVSIVRELVTNYPIDGIHWDYEIGGVEYTAGMGYPMAPPNVYPNSGLARYQRITGTSGTPANNDVNWSNFRRRVVSELLARCQAEIESITSNPRQPVRHTAAVMAYGHPPANCSFVSEESYTYFSDWPLQLQMGWLDAAIPMNYKQESIPEHQAMYRNYCNRAAACWQYQRHIFMGHAGYLNSRASNIVQMQYAYNAGLKGTAIYDYGQPSNDGGNWWSYVASNLHTTPATTPHMPWRDPATATTGTLWGRVIDGSNGKPVDDAVVTVGGLSPVRTDGNGYYVATMIPCVASGTNYSVSVVKSGVGSAVASADVPAGGLARKDFVLNIQPPIIIAEPASFAYAIRPGQNLTADVLSVRNDPTGERTPLQYTISRDADWLSVNPTTGISTGQPNPHTISYTTAGLPAGNYVGTITISDPAAANNPQQIVVHLSIRHPGDVDADGDVDLTDFGFIQACLTALSVPASPECVPADCDGDGDVDAHDVPIWIGCSAGPGNPPVPGCY